MTRAKKIVVVITAVMLVATIGVTAVYATKNSPGENELGQIGQQAEQVQTIKSQTANQALAAARRGLDPEQIDWILYAIDNGKLPDLTAEQLADLYAGVMRLLEDGFAAGFGDIDPEIFARVFAMYEDGRIGDLKAVLGAGQRIDFDMGSQLERALAEGAIPRALYDVIVSAMETGELAISDEQAAELQAYILGILAQALAEEKIPQALYDIAVAAIETGEFEPTTEQIAELQAYALGMLDRALADGKIPQEYYDMIAAAIKTGECKPLALAVLNQALEDGKITQEWYDIITAAIETGEFEPLTVAALNQALEEGKITQEWYDIIAAAIETEEFEPLAIAALNQALEEGKIAQEYYDVIIAAIETGEFELTEEMRADLQAGIKEHLLEGLAAAREEGIISQKLYGILASGIETGSIVLNTELLMELHVSAITLLTRLLNEGVITQEQYDALVTVIGDVGRQLAVRGYLY